MTFDEFWQIIDTVHVASTGDMDQKCELLRTRLRTLDPQDLSDFIAHFDTADAAAFTWPLWGAAYVMHGGCSDDSFSDFRATLISHGRCTYERALADPESLSDLDFDEQEDVCYEGFQYVANEVAEVKGGERPKRTMPFPENPAGEEWDEETVVELYPKLSAKYSGDRSGGGPSTVEKPWWKIW